MGHNRNLADYAHHFDGTHIDLGSGNIETQGVVTYEDVTNVDAIGIVTARAGVRVPDSQTVKMGTGGDLSIYHNGSNSHISNTTGGLYIDENIADGDIFLRADNGSGALTNYLFCDGSSGRVVLSHYGSGKIQTSSTGATVTGTLVSDSVTSELDLSAISASISDTAVDVFVYDTRKDSDGGAWRKRTQHTSWYNETLGTATRGTRKEFPAVAVLVLEAGKLTIYDGDDPDLPMWMVFNNTGSNISIFGRSLSTRTSVEMLNGLLVIGGSYSNAHYEAFTHINFISEKCQQTDNTGTVVFHKNISQRGETSTYTLDLSSFTIVNIVSVNDVAMTVLPNAPIDDATGLPVPTIAVGTGDGVSIIKDDGSVIDYTHQNATYDVTSFVEFLGDDRVAYAWDSDTTPRRFFVTPVRSADTATVDPSSYPRDVVDTVGYGRPTDSKVVGNYHGHLIGNDQSVAAGMNGSMLAVGDGSDGLNLVDVQEAGDDTFNSRIAFITKDYNTGWQYGNIKGTFLSDTDDTNLSSSDLGLITNGDFSNGTTGWSNDATEIFTVSGGVASVDRNGGSAQGQCYQTITTEIGRTYTVSVNVTAVSNGFQVYAGGGSPAMSQGAVNSTGTHYWTFTAISTSTRLDFSAVQNVNGTASFDNITIFDGVADRSVNSKGLSVLGTVTKSAVATGAELVGYSGNGTSNYLEQPYNSDLDFGANSEFSVMGWMYNTNVGGGQYIFDRSVTYGSSRDWQLWVAADLKYINMYIAGGQTVTSGNNAFPNNAWFQFVVVRTGGFAKIYINGVEKGSTASTLSTIPASNVPMKVLFNCNSNTKLSLFRMSSSVPSPEQIKKMYEDEKVLFQENAKATLYGSSDAVTALGYDEDTELLHVGTSSGRSDFQGLRRINNTTTAVTTAISASDELIAEQ